MESAFESKYGNRISALGFLRLGLFALVALDLAIPAFYQLASLLMDSEIKQLPMSVFASVIAPVMAPILMVVLLFEYVMSRVRAADEQGDARSFYQFAGRLELILIGVMLAYWIPFFLTL